MTKDVLTYFCDQNRHLICSPYSIVNLHKMAEDLGIDRCWFHNQDRRWHYDIPKKRVDEIQKKCQIISSKEIVRIMQDHQL